MTSVPDPFIIRDISIPLRADFPVWPGHETPRLTLAASHENGDGVQITDLALGAHTATHLDAPRHFIPGGGLVTELDLNVLIGPVRVVRYEGDGPIPVSFFANLNLPDPVTRLILKCDRNAGTLHDRDTFFKDYAAVSPPAADYLVEHGLRLIGTDYLSIGPFHEGNHETHVVLLGAGVIIVEGLDLRHIEAGDYTLLCLPIAAPADGMPCRAVLLPAGALPEPLASV